MSLSLSRLRRERGHVIIAKYIFQRLIKKVPRVIMHVYIYIHVHVCTCIYLEIYGHVHSTLYIFKKRKVK